MFFRRTKSLFYVSSIPRLQLMLSVCGQCRDKSKQFYFFCHLIIYSYFIFCLILWFAVSRTTKSFLSDFKKCLFVAISPLPVTIYVTLILHFLSSSPCLSAFLFLSSLSSFALRQQLSSWAADEEKYWINTLMKCDVSFGCRRRG